AFRLRNRPSPFSRAHFAVFFPLKHLRSYNRDMKTGFKIGDFELTWLNGGRFELDGGAMFGVVPKVLWQKKYPANADNCIPLQAWPILIKTPNALLLVESGLGNKLTDKQKKIYR